MSHDEPIPFSRPWVADEDLARVTQVLRSGWWTTGPLVKEFEQRFAEYVGARYAVALNSCTAALHVALVAAGVGRGDIVLTTTWTFAATAEVVAYLGAIPVLLDVDQTSLNINASQIEVLCDCLAADQPQSALRKAVAAGALPRGAARALPDDATIADVKAIIPVHYAGWLCDMQRILSVASKYGIPVIEDAAHAVETTDGERHAGTFGRVGAFSFYATKNLSTGEGGMATTDDSAMTDRMRSLSLHGISRDAWKRYTAAGTWRYDILEPGFKYNMTDVAAALGVGQLGRIDELHSRRLAIVERYNHSLRGVDNVITPNAPDRGTHAWHLYVLRVKSAGSSENRDRLIELLQERGVGTSVHFIPLHMHSYYRDRFGYQPGDFPVADRAFDEVLSLPLYPSLTDDEIDRVAAAVKDIVGAGSGLG